MKCLKPQNILLSDGCLPNGLCWQSNSSQVENVTYPGIPHRSDPNHYQIIKMLGSVVSFVPYKVNQYFDRSVDVNEG